MSQVELVKRVPSARDFMRLRKAVGWHVPDSDSAALSLENTLFSVCVEADGECVGFGRVVGDGSLVFHVQDVIVLPEHQRRGYGSMIMDALMEYIHGAARPTAFIALFASPRAADWYSRYGFVRRPNPEYGPGMAFFKE